MLVLVSAKKQGVAVAPSAFAIDGGEAMEVCGVPANEKDVEKRLWSDS